LDSPEERFLKTLEVKVKASERAEKVTQAHHRGIAAG